jgi:hypothetical protein
VIRIVLEVLCLALGAVGVYLAVNRYLYDNTKLGLRGKQNDNRFSLEDKARRTCPIHGQQPANSLVLLPNGMQQCPLCYTETLKIKEP